MTNQTRRTRRISLKYWVELPDSVLSIIDSARKYAEGRGVRLEVRSKRDLENIKELAAIKMAN
jgi:hypothetical protein